MKASEHEIAKALEIAANAGRVAGERDEARREAERLRAEVAALRLAKDLAR